MPPINHKLLQLVREQVVAQYGDVWFMLHWPWPNPDTGHLRLKLPPTLNSVQWPRRSVDLRIRPAAACLPTAALPDHLRPDMAHVGCWTFDGAEQVAMADFWILVQEPPNNAPPICVVVPTQRLLHHLRQSADAGRFYLYFTHRAECYASPSLQTKLSALRQTHGPGITSSSVCLTMDQNAWHELARC